LTFPKSEHQHLFIAFPKLLEFSESLDLVYKLNDVIRDHNYLQSKEKGKIRGLIKKELGFEKRKG